VTLKIVTAQNPKNALNPRSRHAHNARFAAILTRKNLVSDATPPNSVILQPLLRAWRVAFDKNEGVVKRHMFAAMLCSTAWISEWWRTEALKLSR